MQKDEERWEERFSMFKEYVSEFSRLPASTEEYHGVKLGQWLRNQRLAFKAGTLPINRKEKLDSFLPDWRGNIKEILAVNKKLLLASDWQRKVNDVPIDRFLTGDELFRALRIGIYDCGSWLERNGGITSFEKGLDIFRCYGLLYPYICPSYAYFLADTYLQKSELKNTNIVRQFIMALPFRNVKDMSTCVEDVLCTFRKRDRECIHLRYGMATGDTMSFREIGEVYGITASRASQILEHCKRRLWAPTYRKKIFSSYELGKLNLSELEEKQLLRKGYRTISDIVHADASSLPIGKKVEVVKTTETELQELIRKNVSENTQSIKCLAFSNRTYNALMRARITTVAELWKRNEKRLSEEKWIGKNSLQEIEEKLEYLLESSICKNRNSAENNDISSSGNFVLFYLVEKQGYYSSKEVIKLFRQ